MARPRKTKQDAAAFGRHIRQRRLRANLTLMEVAAATGVNVGQLSRFESGEFSFVTENLQAVADFLQIRQASLSSTQEQLVSRFAGLLQRSRRHEKAGAALLIALESLQ